MQEGKGKEKDRAVTTPLLLPKQIPAERSDRVGETNRWIKRTTPEEFRIQEVYGGWVHSNPGTHLHGGIRDNENCQGWWRDLAVIPSQRYDTPSGKVGQHFVVALVEGLRRVRGRLWNLERFIVFHMVIL